MNVYDSERIVGALGQQGYSETDSPEDADIIVLNTCHIREKAAEKVYSDLGRIRDIKAEREAVGKETIVTVAGCVAQAEGRQISVRAPVVDIVVGPQSYQNLPELLAKVRQTKSRVVDTQFPDGDKFSAMPPREQPRAASAFLTVQEGCDKFCSFCVVPYTRGLEFSRTVAAIEAEAKRLADFGVREITLLGQNVNAYHGEGPDGSSWTLAQLLKNLAKIDGVERLRYMTSHPRDMSDDLINAHADLDELMPFLHLPFQSGSDRILAAMNRKHTADDYHRLIDRIKKAKPDIALSTDIIVGFPGETDDEFEQTIRLVQTIGFAQAYSFKYSARPGTPAASLDDQLPESLKSERLLRLQDLLFAQQKSFNHGCVGQVLQVLLDKPGRHDRQLIGRSPYLQSVHVEADGSALGKIASVDITKATQNSLTGKIVALR